MKSLIFNMLKWNSLTAVFLILACKVKWRRTSAPPDWVVWDVSPIDNLRNSTLHMLRCCCSHCNHAALLAVLLHAIWTPSSEDVSHAPCISLGRLMRSFHIAFPSHIFCLTENFFLLLGRAIVALVLARWLGFRHGKSFSFNALAQWKWSDARRKKESRRATAASRERGKM